MTKRIYLAGPMTGHRQYNFPAFLAAAIKIEAMGWEVISPAQMDIDRGFNPITDPRAVWTKEMLAPAIRMDVDAILNSQAIAMMDGWEQSKGATAEYHVAKWAGVIPYRFYEKRNQMYEIFN